MKKITFLLLTLGMSALASAQCLSGVPYPDETAVPDCNGISPTDLSFGYGYAGEYSLVTLTEGETYTFSSSIDTDYITISNEDGSTAVVFGVGPLTWTADASGDYRFYTHTDDACGEEEEIRSRYVLCGTPPPPPANDDCASAISIPAGDSYSYDQTDGGGSTNNDGYLLTCSDNGQNDGTWFSFEGDGNEVSITITPDEDFDPQLAVFSGSCGTFECVDTIDEGFPGDEEELEFVTEVGVTYYINVGYFDDAEDQPEGNFNLSMSRQAPEAVPANDACAGAIAIPTEETYSYEQTDGDGATNNDGFITTCSNGMNDGLWFSFEGDGSAIEITVTPSAGTDFDSQIGVYSGSCDAATCVGTVDDTFEGEVETISLLTTEVGVTYYINVADYSGFSDNDEGPFTIEVTRSAAVGVPDNDACDGAYVIPTQMDEFTYEQTDGAGATNNDGFLETCEDNGQNDGLWFTFTGDGNHVNIAVDPAAGFDPQVTVLSGSCGTFTCVTTIDNAGTGDVENVSVLNSEVGTTYFINVGHYSGFTDNPEGNFTISVTRETPPAALPDCAANPTPVDGAVDVPTGVVTFSWDAPTTGGPVDGYKIYGGINQPLTEDDLIDTVTETSIDLTITGFSTTFFWKVVPTNTLGDAEGCAEWTFTTVAPPPPPANDACADAIAITTLPYSNSSDDSGATNNDGFLTGCAPGQNDGTWYTVVGDGGDITIAATSDIDGELGVFTGDCGALTCVGSVDEGLAGDTETFIIEGSQEGTVYYINFGYYASGTDEAEGQLDIEVSSSLSVNDNDLSSLKAYPNPVTSVLNLDYIRNIESVAVSNLLGQQVLTQSVNSANARIDMTPLSAGTYLVKIIADGVARTLKVVKQ